MILPRYGHQTWYWLKRKAIRLRMCVDYLIMNRNAKKKKTGTHFNASHNYFFSVFDMKLDYWQHILEAHKVGTSLSVGLFSILQVQLHAFCVNESATNAERPSRPQHKHLLRMHWWCNYHRKNIWRAVTQTSTSLIESKQSTWIYRLRNMYFAKEKLTKLTISWCRRCSLHARQVYL